MYQTILLIDDDPAQIRLMEMTLTAANYSTLTAANGETGLQMFTAHEPDLVISDVMMPGMDGWETCYRIRQISTVPIIFLTGRKTDDDKVSGLKLGADDYLVKPFMPDELLARVEAVLRRTYGTPQPLTKFLRAGRDILINRDSHEVFVRGEVKSLRPAEYTLLTLLAEHAGENLTINALGRALGIQDRERSQDRVKWHVWKLRQTIEVDPGQPEIILTEAGEGYRIDKV